MENGKGPELADYIQAGYPGLFLRTGEPHVAEKMVTEALVNLGMGAIEYGTWKVTTGLMIGRADGAEEPKANANARNLGECLAFIGDSKKPIVGVFHNVRQFVDHNAIIQQMVDSIMAARLIGSHIILVGPSLDLPVELKNLITFVDVPLPTKAEIQDDFKRIVKAYEEDVNLPEDQEELDDLLRAAANAAVGLDSMGAENAIALSLATAEEIDLNIVAAQKEQQVRQSDVLEFIDTRETMDNVGGFDVLKHWLSRRERVFTDEAREYGLSYPKGMLIVGPAGTGKSLVAKATASYLRLPALRLDMGKVFKSLVGESEGAIRGALKVAEAVSPVVLWIDEIDKGLAGMKGSGELDSGVTARVVSTILTWRQETTYPVMLVATANDVAALPSMVYRKGRLDEVWATDLPNESERREIFEIHLRKRKRNPKKFKCELLAARSKDSTGAEIEAYIEDAMFSAFDKGKEVSDTHILAAIKDTIPQAQRDHEELKAIREWVNTRAKKVSSGEQVVAAKAPVRRIHSK